MLMEKSVFTGIADRIAKQYSYIKVCFEALSATGMGEDYYERVTLTNDPDVELSMLQSAYNTDVDFRTQTPQRVTRNLSSFVNLITSFENHLQREGTILTRSWDAYCQNQDVRVSDYTNQVHFSRKNSYMNARNVFCEDEVTFASVIMSDATTINFSDGVNFGDGSVTAKADGNNFAGTQLKAIVVGSNEISSLVVNITGLDEFGQVKTLENITISGIPGTEVIIGSEEDRWVDVTNITRVSGGNVGDEFEIHNIKERIIQF